MLSGFKRMAGISFFTIVFLFSIKAEAQIKNVPRRDILTTNQSVRILNSADFRKTTLYTTRVQLYGAKFTNPSKSFSMTDGTSMNVNFIKNPNFANQPNSVTPTLYHGPVHGASVNVPVQAVTESNQDWVCDAYNVVDRANSINFEVTDNNQQIPYIYPGAVFTFDNFMNGSLQPPSGERNPITLFTDHSTSNNLVQVSNPNQGNVQNAISGMVNHFIGSGNISTNYKYYESNNMADWTIKVNGGTGNFGGQINTAFNTTDRRHHRYITIDVTKQLYSVITNPPSDGFYSKTNSTEATPNLMVVGSVGYGVRLLVNMELTFASNADAVAFQNKFSYLSYSTTLDLNYLQSHALDIANISSYEIGGPNSGTVFVNSNNIQSNINSILASVNNQNAKPVSYQLYDMAWDIIGATASTCFFNYANCMVAPPPPPSNPVLTSGSLTITCGDDGKNHSSTTWIDVFSPQNKVSLHYDDWYSPTLGLAGKTWPANATETLQFATSNFNGSLHLNDFKGTWRITLMITSGAYVRDDVKNFSLTLTLNYKQINGQNTPYSLTWHNLNLSTGFSNSNSNTLNLPFNYFNGQFIALPSYSSTSN